MVASTLIYGAFTSLLTYSALHQTHKIIQFANYENTYGKKPNITLTDLIEEAEKTNQELPSFKIIVPAYGESDVIEATIRNLVKSNYPTTHFEINISTHEEDLSPTPDTNTTSIVEQTAKEVNEEVGYELVKSIVVPERYDGFFPGDVDSEIKRRGKPKNLNYVIRKTHEDNERDERKIFIGLMYENNHVQNIDYIVEFLSKKENSPKKVDLVIQKTLTPKSEKYIGSLALSRQLIELTELTNSFFSSQKISNKSAELLRTYISQQASKFFFEIEGDESVKNKGPISLQTMQEKEFLSDIMNSIENADPQEVIDYYKEREVELDKTRPILSKKMHEALSSEEIYQLTKQINSRWIIVYDADADAPRDVMRYYAASILTDPSIMAFQGPVAPIGNTEDVTSFPRMAGFQFGFNHISYYPRFLHKEKWGHPLAGTNWCLILEGMVDEDTVSRELPYDESKRELFTYFKPDALTEDLELGLRLFSDWKINARWHPYVEIEQVPPNAEALRRQRIRWAEGNLALLEEIWEMEIPLIQKMYYSVYPVNSVITAATPILCTAYIAGILSGKFEIDTIYGILPVMLAASNLLYSFEFTLPLFKLQKHVEANYPYDEMYHLGNFIHEELAEGKIKLSSQEHSMLEDTVKNLKKGIKKRGFLTKYTENRCIDETINEFEPQVYDLDSINESTSQIPSIQEFKTLVDRLYEDINYLTETNNYTSEDNSQLQQQIEKIHGVSLLHKKDLMLITKRVAEFIVLFLPYTFHAAYMPLKAVHRKITGKANKSWDKTPRTVKKMIQNDQRL